MSLNTDGLKFFYGNYVHPIGEVFCSRYEIRPMFNNRGVRWASEYRMQVGGDLVSPTGGPLTQAQVTARIDAMNTAYNDDYKDCGFRFADDTDTPHVMASDDSFSLSGNQILHRSWDNRLPTEYANSRSFSIAIRNLVVQSYSPIISLSETVTQYGDGGPKWRFRERFNAVAIKQQVSSHSKVRYVQQGVLIGMTGLEAIPAPYWPNNELGWLRVTSNSLPQRHGYPTFDRGTHYEQRYRYVFAFAAGSQPYTPATWATS